MRYTVFALLSLLLIAGCLFDNSKSAAKEEKSTLLIQINSNSAKITSIIAQLTPLINCIVKEELHLPQDYNFDFFIPKEAQRITLYYVNDINQHDLQVLLSTLDAIQFLDMSYDTIFASSKVEFFGDQQDELVIMIDDQNKELAELNQRIADRIHQINDQYKIEKGYDFYNRAKSERFPFLPHMGLGRVRMQSIKNNIQDPSQVESIIQRIKERVKTETSEIIQKLLSDGDTKLSFDKAGVLDPKARAYIREWLKNLA